MTIKKGWKYWVHRPASLLRRLNIWLGRRWHNLSGRQRIACASIASVIILGTIIPTALHIIESQRYLLDAATVKLVGNVNANLASKLTYDEKQAQWDFNKIDEQPTSPTPDETPSLKTQVGGIGKNDESLYSTSFPKDPKKGVTFTDTQTQLSFTMKPQFKLSSGQLSDGRLIYPMEHGGKLIYSAKNNGMKEDIILPKFIEKEMTFSYDLDLPKTLDARILDDGSVGIYSGDPILFGDISTTTDMDAEKLRSAREQGEKTHLLFAIPAPVIVSSNDKDNKSSAKFGLSGSTLTVTARDLDKATYPLSVDPSIVVTSSSDFSSGHNEGNISFNTDQIDRANVSGGAITAGWSATGSGAFTGSYKAMAVVHNGYLYHLGGALTRNATTNVSQYAPINSDGTVGAWNTTTSLPTNRAMGGVGVHNGKIYVYGGWAGGQNLTNSVIYSTINSDGTLGGWTTSANTMAATVCRFGAAIYNGYLYAAGGQTTGLGQNSDCDSTGISNQLQYAQILANGDVGSWTISSQTFTNARRNNGLAVYNNNMYLWGGDGASAAQYGDTQIARVGLSGDIGPWRISAQTMSNPISNANFSYSAYNGHLYTIMGRNSGSLTSYAQILGNGDIGPWTSTSSWPTFPPSSSGAVIYKDHIYSYGGIASGGGLRTDTMYAKIDAAGTLSSSTSTTAFGTGIDGSNNGSAFVNNGYIYHIGGFSGDYSSQARFAPINNSGTIGTWALTTAVPPPTTGATGIGAHAYAIANNRVYLIGGITTLTAGGVTNVNTIQYASFNNDGTLGSWTTNPTPYVNAISNQPAVAYNGRVYVRGFNGGGSSNRVYSAPVNNDGTLGSWTWEGGASNNSPVTSAYGNMLAYNNYLYIIGGRDGTTYLNNVQYAPINSDGSLGTWGQTSAMNTARASFGSVIINGYMYSIGGETSNGVYTATNESAKINADGTLSAWTNNTSSAVTTAGGGITSWNDNIYVITGRHNGTRGKQVIFHKVRSGGGGGSTAGSTTNATSFAGPYANGWSRGQVFTSNGYLYAIGGYSGTGPTTSGTTWYAPLNNDGSVGSWTQTTTLNSARQRFGIAIANNNVYVMGGLGAGGSELSSIEYASISPTGGLGSWTTSSNSLSNGRQDIAAVTRGGYLYVSGGQNGTTYYNDVQYAPINNDGSVGTWATTTAVTGVRYGHGMIVYGDRLYIIGGRGQNGYLSDAYFASFGSNGTVGSWTKTTGMPQDRAHFGIAASSGNIYLISGHNGDGVRSDTIQGVISPNGHIADWQYSVRFNTARHSPAATMTNGTLYFVGGENNAGTTFYNDILYNPLDIQPRVATYSKAFDIGPGASVTGITYSGSGVSNVTVKQAGTDGIYGTLQNASSITSTGGVCVANPKQYLFVTVTLDDSTRETFNGTAANLTDLTVNYLPIVAETNKRLAHGKSFSGESLQPLDTCKI